jgi:hypothetical protein
LTRDGFLSPSLDRGLPLFELFRPSRRSSSAIQETTVSIATDLAVKVLFVTAYRFQHAASEHWVGGRLIALNSTTDDNGTRHRVSVA